MKSTEYRYIDENKSHMHTLHGKPLLGASTVVGIIDKSGPLMKWAVNLAVEAMESGSSPEVARKAHITKRDAAADKGTAMHERLEVYVRECMKSGGVLATSDEVPEFAEWAADNVEQFLFSEANCFSEEMWVGGISDCGARLKSGKLVVIDFKSSREAYKSQFLQCALYDIMLMTNGGLDADGAKQFEWKGADGYIVFPFGSKPLRPEFRWDVVNVRERAREAVNLYKFNRNI